MVPTLLVEFEMGKRPGQIDWSSKIDWAYLLQQALILRCRRMVNLGLLLAKQVLGAPVPIQIINNIEKDDLVLRLSRDVHGIDIFLMITPDNGFQYLFNKNSR